MFDWFKNRVQDRAKAQELYGAVVTLARTPGFYSRFGVPDTPEGRFEMVAAVLFLVMERLKTVPGAEKLTQTTIEAFVTDMDDCMREMGVGDLVVAKRVKRAAAAFYERAGDYRAALAQPDDTALAQALTRHVFHDEVAVERAQGLAGAVRSIQRALAGADNAAVTEGRAVTATHVLAGAA